MKEFTATHVRWRNFEFACKCYAVERKWREEWEAVIVAPIIERMMQVLDLHLA